MKVWHKLTPLFTRNIYERIAVVNNHWNHYPIVQQIESGAFKPPIQKNVDPIDDYYFSFPSPLSNKINKILEYNGPTNFFPLLQKGVDVHAFQKGEPLDTRTQAEPDDVFNFQKAQFEDKRIHGMDHKAYEDAREVESRIFSQLSTQKYQTSLKHLENLIINNCIDLTPKQLHNIALALDMLSRSCEDIVKHQLIWAEHVHYFPAKYIPPIKIPQNFSLANVTPDFLKAFKKSEWRMQKISDRLYELNAPENDLKKGIQYFEDSYIKNIMNTPDSDIP